VGNALRLAASQLRLDLSDRRGQVALAVGVLVVFGLFLAFAIGTGDYSRTVFLGGIALMPPLVVLALKRPYLFPYGLYLVLVPLDNMLLIHGVGTLTRLLGIAATAFVVIQVMREKRLGRPPLTASLGLAYLGWMLISLVWTPDVSHGLSDVQSMGSLIVMYAVLSVAPISERDLRVVCGCIVAGGVIASVYGISLLHGSGDVGAEYGRLLIDVDNRVIDPNHFANSLLAPLALAIAGLLRSRSPGLLLTYGGAIAIMLAGQVVSLSREGLLGTVLIGTVLILFSKRRVLGLAIGAAVVTGLAVMVPAIGSRMLEAFGTGGGGRSFIWHIVWRAWLQHPLFGWGAGGAIDAYDRNYLNVYALVSQSWGRPPHNTPLHILVELGIVGFVLVGAAYLAAFRQLRGIARGDRLYDVRAALTASLIAIGFVSLLIDLATYKYLWVILVTVAQLRTVANQRAAAHEASPVPLPAVAPRPRVRPRFSSG
jgi:O-antigen ligase